MWGSIGRISSLRSEPRDIRCAALPAGTFKYGFRDGVQGARHTTIQQHAHVLAYLQNIRRREVEDLGEYGVLVAEQTAAGDKSRREAVRLDFRPSRRQSSLRLQREKDVTQFRVLVWTVQHEFHGRDRGKVNGARSERGDTREGECLRGVS